MVAMNCPTTESVREAWETLIDARDEDHADAWREIMAERLSKAIPGMDLGRMMENISHAQLAIHGIQGSFELLKAVLDCKEVKLVQMGD